MDNYFKYKRIVKILKEEEIQSFFDELTKEGWEIIDYNENNDLSLIKIRLVVGKKQSNIL